MLSESSLKPFLLNVHRDFLPNNSYLKLSENSGQAVLTQYHYKVQSKQFLHNFIRGFIPNYFYSVSWESLPEVILKPFYPRIHSKQFLHVVCTTGFIQNYSYSMPLDSSFQFYQKIFYKSSFTILSTNSFITIPTQRYQRVNS